MQATVSAGMAFSNAIAWNRGTSMAHKTGAAFSTGHIPHGCANRDLSSMLSNTTQRSVAAKRYAEIARRMGLPSI